MTRPERVNASLKRAASRLRAFSEQIERIDTNALDGDEWLLLRGMMGNTFAAFDDNVSEVDRELNTTGAKAKILRYLQLRFGEVVSKDELSAVAGIHEWARRVRELREDEGWVIHSSTTRHGLRVGEYLLAERLPDPELAERWTLARQMRDLRDAGGRAPREVRLLEFLKAISPRPADADQLLYLVGNGSAVEHALTSLSRHGWAVSRLPFDHEVAPGGVALTSVDRGIGRR